MSSSRNLAWTVLVSVGILTIQILRFSGLDQAPPGFYIDEAVGAAQALCLKQTGADYYGKPWPLFPPGLGAGFYTPTYITGQILWTSVFGESVAAFRGFVAWITMLTILFFSLYLQRAVGGEEGRRTALWFALLASISPWAWQFSRVAWDPPLAPFFISAALWVMSFAQDFTGEGHAQGRFSRWAPYVSGALFAAAAYSYPPTRVQALILLLAIPLLSWKKTFQAFAAFLVVMIPLLIRGLDEDFRARGNLVGIWSTYPGNPYHDAGILGQAWGAVKNFFLHLSPDFLLGSGDSNLRHSTQKAGVLSWLDALGLAVGVMSLKHASVRKALTVRGKSLIWVGLVGAFTGILPAALTWESVPHSLRAIAAWPFVVLLAAYAFSVWTERAGKWRGWVQWGAVAVGAAFSVFYLHDYFYEYPSRANAWFSTENQPFATAYERMQKFGVSCEAVRP